MVTLDVCSVHSGARLPTLAPRSATSAWLACLPTCPLRSAVWLVRAGALHLPTAVLRVILAPKDM